MIWGCVHRNTSGVCTEASTVSDVDVPLGVRSRGGIHRRLSRRDRVCLHLFCMLDLMDQSIRSGANRISRCDSESVRRDRGREHLNMLSADYAHGSILVANLTKVITLVRGWDHQYLLSKAGESNHPCGRFLHPRNVYLGTAVGCDDVEASPLAGDRWSPKRTCNSALF